MSCPHGEWHDEDCELCQKDARIYELECQVERLRVCGNCKHYLPVWLECSEQPTVDDDADHYYPSPQEHCCFTPSRWQAREEAGDE